MRVGQSIGGGLPLLRRKVRMIAEAAGKIIVKKLS